MSVRKNLQRMNACECFEHLLRQTGVESGSSLGNAASTAPTAAPSQAHLACASHDHEAHRGFVFAPAQGNAEGNFAFNDDLDDDAGSGITSGAAGDTLLMLCQSD